MYCLYIMDFFLIVVFIMSMSLYCCMYNRNMLYIVLFGLLGTVWGLTFNLNSALMLRLR